MPLKPTTSSQVDGHRFLVRRARHAVAAGDVRMLHDPLRRHDVGLGLGLAAGAVVCAGAVVLSVLGPSPDVDDAVVMVGSDSGALYVRLGGVAHPALNLASARLAVGTPESPVRVRDSDLADTARGGLLGIPGAPSTLPAPLDADTAGRARWTVCDTVGTDPADDAGVIATGVAVDLPERPAADAGALDAGEAVLAGYDGRTWLLRAGTRAPIDLADRPLLELLGLADAPVRPVSAAVLDALPDVGAVARPVVPRAGEPVGYGLDGLGVGQVFTVDGAAGEETFVALADGVQEVGPLVGDLVRSAVTVGEVAHLSPDRIAVPRSRALDVDALPRERPRVPSPVSAPVLCVRTAADRAATGRPRSLVVAATAPWTRPPTPTAGADGPGPAVDEVSVPGGGLLVTPEPRGAVGRPPGPRTVLADTGVRFDVPDAETAEMLGVGGEPVPVDAATLRRLPAGPLLERPAALLVHDGLQAPGGTPLEAAPR